MMVISNWPDLAAFVEMGGYGLYVWGSFGMAAAVMAAELVALRTRRQALHATAHPPTAIGDFEVATHEA